MEGVPYLEFYLEQCAAEVSPGLSPEDAAWAWGCQR